jgi:hypothetical protein
MIVVQSQGVNDVYTDTLNFVGGTVTVDTSTGIVTATLNPPVYAAPVVTGSNNNLAWSDKQTVAPTLTGASAWSITGIVAPSFARDPLYIINNTGQNMTLKHASGSSTAANRIYHGSVAGGSDIIIADGGTATLLYDSTVSGWRVISST